MHFFWWKPHVWQKSGSGLTGSKMLKMAKFETFRDFFPFISKTALTIFLISCMKLEVKKALKLTKVIFSGKIWFGCFLGPKVVKIAWNGWFLKSSARKWKITMWTNSRVENQKKRIVFNKFQKFTPFWAFFLAKNRFKWLNFKKWC